MRLKIRLNITFLFILFPVVSMAQWYIAPNLPLASRYDDIVFINQAEGWTINSGGDILHTTDQGQTWNLQIDTDKYLRCIEFVDQNIGFCGSLDSSLFKTTDGGANWADISNNIYPKPPGICGLSAPNASTVYGCGIWSSPAYIIKSTDTGNSWTHIDMSSYATALVDIEFSSVDTGFVVGTANPASDGGIILHTTDGGLTWTTKFLTNVGLDYVWKIQSPDGVNFYASVDAVPVTNNLRILKSTDSGNTWTMDTVLNTYVYTQLVGFINPNHGWLGAGSNLYETTDGGVTWNNTFVGSSYNRFHKVNDNLAFLSGSEIYRYGESNLGTETIAEHDEVHELVVTPNPAVDFIQIDLKINSKTKIQLMLLDMQGRILETFLDEVKSPSKHSFTYTVKNLNNQALFVVLKCNEGLVYRKILVQ